MDPSDDLAGNRRPAPQWQREGEIVTIVERYVVAPERGRFHGAPLRLGVEGLPMVVAGDIVGEVRRGVVRTPVECLFTASVVARITQEGDHVTRGQILMSLRLP